MPLTEKLEKIQHTPNMIRCAHVSFYGPIDEPDFRDEGFKEYKYVSTNSEEELNNFFEFLDTEYDSGFGGEELFGKIWFWDYSWLERAEYDGSEWWEYKKYEIPDYLLNN